MKIIVFFLLVLNTLVYADDSADLKELAYLQDTLQIEVVRDTPKAPDFTLKLFKGDSFTLTKNLNTPILLHFWASWCGPCVNELPELNRFYNDLDKTKLTVIGINADEKNVPAVGNLISKFNIFFPVVLDDKQAISAQYGVRAFPTTILVSKEGTILAQINGAREWNSQPVKRWIELITKDKTLAKTFKSIADQQPANLKSPNTSSAPTAKTASAEEIRNILPNFSVKVSTPKNSLSPNEPFIVSVSFTWTETEKNRFFIRPPVFPIIEGLTLLETSSETIAQNSNNGLTYNYLFTATKVGELALTPLKVDYVLIGYENSSQSTYDGITLSIQGLSILGLPMLYWGIICGLVFLILIITYIVWRLSSKKNLNIKNLQNEKTQTLEKLSDILHDLNTASMKKDSQYFLQALLNLENTIKNSQEPFISTFSFILEYSISENNKKKFDQIRFAGQQFDISEMNFYLNKVQEGINNLKVSTN